MQCRSPAVAGYLMYLGGQLMWPTAHLPHGHLIHIRMSHTSQLVFNCLCLFFFFFFCFSVGGKEGNVSCTITPSGAMCGTPVWLADGSILPIGQFCQLTYPLKPSHAGDTQPHPFIGVWQVDLCISSHLP